MKICFLWQLLVDHVVCGWEVVEWECKVSVLLVSLFVHTAQLQFKIKSALEPYSLVVQLTYSLENESSPENKMHKADNQGQEICLEQHFISFPYIWADCSSSCKPYSQIGSPCQQNWCACCIPWCPLGEPRHWKTDHDQQSLSSRLCLAPPSDCSYGTPWHNGTQLLLCHASCHQFTRELKCWKQKCPVHS